MKNILVPVDFSENAMIAFDYACHIALHMKAEMTILNIYNTPGKKENREAKIKEIEQFVEDYEKKDSLKSLQDIKVGLEAISGDPLEEITKFTDKYGCRLIIMGTKGLSDDDHEKMGSLTAEVIRITHCPVMAIPADVDFQPPAKILFALDYEDFDYGKMKTLELFANQFNSRIILLHINVEGYLDEEKFRNYKEALDRLSDYDNIVFDFIKAGDFIKGLTSYVDEKQIDILAMTSRKRHLMQQAYDKSLTKNMLMYSNVPLLVFHD